MRLVTAPGIAVLAIFLFLGGCTYIHSDMPPVPDFDNGEPEPGTHYSILLDQLGPPTSLAPVGDGMAWQYEQMDLAEDQIGIGFSQWPLSLFKLNFGAGQGEHHVLLLVFDGNGELVNAHKKETPVKLGSGVGFEVIFKVSSLVDMSDIKQPSDPNKWGGGLLVSLPEGLNRKQATKSGGGGLQMMTTPDGAGQNTLSAP